MAGKERGEDTSIAARLLRECHRFSFFNAVALLERLEPEREAPGEALTPRRETVRFAVAPGFSFPASDLGRLDPADGEVPPTLEVAFLGLVGPSGILPEWCHELALERKNRKEDALTDFFDIFHHRLLSLFFLAWKKHRIEASFRPDASDRFSLCLRSLIGLGTEGVQGRLGLPDESPIYFSGLFSRGVPCAGAVCAAVRYYFRVDAAIDQFVARPITLEPSDRTVLGQGNCRLGENAVVGSQACEAQTRFRLNLGPMPFSSYLRFLPGGDLLAPLCSLVQYQVGIEYEFDVRLILKREEVPACRLGGEGATAARLGWSCWIKSPSVTLPSDPHASFSHHGF